MFLQGHAVAVRAARHVGRYKRRYVAGVGVLLLKELALDRFIDALNNGIDQYGLTVLARALEVAESVPTGWLLAFVAGGILLHAYLAEHSEGAAARRILAKRNREMALMHGVKWLPTLVADQIWADGPYCPIDSSRLQYETIQTHALEAVRDEHIVRPLYFGIVKGDCLVCPTCSGRYAFEGRGGMGTEIRQARQEVIAHIEKAIREGTKLPADLDLAT